MTCFIGFRVPKPFASVSQLPQALFPPEKTRPWISGACILWILSIFIDFHTVRTIHPYMGPGPDRALGPGPGCRDPGPQPGPGSRARSGPGPM